MPAFQSALCVRLCMRHAAFDSWLKMHGCAGLLACLIDLDILAELVSIGMLFSPLRSGGSLPIKQNHDAASNHTSNEERH